MILKTKTKFDLCIKNYKTGDNIRKTSSIGRQYCKAIVLKLRIFSLVRIKYFTKKVLLKELIRTYLNSLERPEFEIYSKQRIQNFIKVCYF